MNTYTTTANEGRIDYPDFTEAYDRSGFGDVITESHTGRTWGPLVKATCECAGFCTCYATA
jgi:hypothetical protein